MNRIQKPVVIGGLFMIALSSLFVPWITVADTQSPVIVVESGYGFLFLVPKQGELEMAVDYGRVILTWVAILAVTGALFLAARREKEQA